MGDNGLCWMCKDAPVVADGNLCSGCLEDIADSYIQAAEERDNSVQFDMDWDAAREAEHQRIQAQIDRMFEDREADKELAEYEREIAEIKSRRARRRSRPPFEAFGRPLPINQWKPRND